jgi:hypothetical protein
MGTGFSDDPVMNAIHKGIRRGIELTIEHKCLSSAVVLILSGIDAMAYLAMPEVKQDVTQSDFVGWAEQYIRFPGREQLTGLDLYGARCAMLHSFGAQSKLSRAGKCRVILWMNHAIPPVLSKPELPGYVMVAVDALRDALFTGMDRFLIDVFKDPKSNKVQIVNKRLNSLVQKMRTEDVLSATAPSSTS